MIMQIVQDSPVGRFGEIRSSARDLIELHSAAITSEIWIPNACETTLSTGRNSPFVQTASPFINFEEDR